MLEPSQCAEYLDVSSDEEDVDLSELEMREKAEFVSGARSLGYAAKMENVAAIRQLVIKDVMSGRVSDKMIPDPVSAGIKEQVERKVCFNVGNFGFE